MVGEACWFVVERTPRGESGSVILGMLPTRLTRKLPTGPDGKPIEPPPVLYKLRLDKLPSEERARWIDPDGVPVISIDRIMQTYRHLRDRGRLPTLTG